MKTRQRGGRQALGETVVVGHPAAMRADQPFQHSAPTEADLEHIRTFRIVEQRDDAVQLALLRVVQCVMGRREHRGGIAHATIEP